MLEINLNPFPILETERLTLRRITLDDAPAYFSLRSNINAMKYICKPLQIDIEESKTLIYKINESINFNDNISWAVCLKNDSTMIGTVSFHKIDKENYRGEIGYMLLPAFWRQGIIGESVAALIEFGFNTLKFHSIEAHIDPNNIGSKQVLQKYNFVKEAHFKENYFFDGKFLDTHVYSLLAINK